MFQDIRLIEIELFSYCNRKCSWCPNRFVDRSGAEELDAGILSNLLLELSLLRYRGAFTFSRYNEPLSRIDVLKPKLRQIRERFPDNKLITNTNGDFLSAEILDGLCLDELTIMDYDGLSMHLCARRLESIGVVIDEWTKPYLLGHRGDMKILYFTDWQEHRHITDRGGILKELSKKVRSLPCAEPTHFVGINYDGTVSPCCNVRSDVDGSKEYILGDLHENTLSEILLSDKAVAFRTACASGNFTIKQKPCFTCENSGGRYTKGNGGIRYE